MRRLGLALVAVLLLSTTVWAGSYWGPTGLGSVGPAGPAGPPGPIGGSGAAPQIAVWSGATTLTGFTDFTWDNANRMLNAGSISTITPTVTDAAILASSNTTLDGSNGFIVNSGTLGTNDASILNGSGYSAIVGSVSALIDQGAVYTGLLGTSGSSIIAGGYSSIIGSSCSSIGGDSITDGCGTSTPTLASYYAALAGTSFGVISGGTYVFIGGASQTAIYDGSTYSAIIGTSDARMGTIGGAGASYSAIAGGQGSMGDNVLYSFIGGGAGSIGDGCSSCAILGDGTVDAGSLNNAVAINGGHATLSAQTAFGTQVTLPSTVFTGLPTSVNGSMIYCSDCDPTATLLACTHVGAQTGAFAYRVNGAWKCMG